MMMRNKQGCAIGGLGILLGMVAPLSSCADECFDDGLAQHGCPSNSGSMSGTGTSGATETASLDGATETDPTAGTATGGYVCPDLEVTLVPQTPTMQLVVDQSGSMDQDFGGLTRWDAVKTTLIEPTDGVVSRFEADIRFGISLYTSPDQMNCPAITEEPPQLNALNSISTLLNMAGPGGQTPTGESLQMITQTVLADNGMGDKFMVLCTDGEPDTCAVPDPETDEEIAEARGTAVQAVADAYAAGVRTFVISVGEGIASDHLQELANAGVGNDPNDPDAEFYVALDQQALIDAFNDILSGVRECKFDLDEPLDMELAPSCTVTVNDNPVPYQDPNGWDLDNETTMELQGDACSSIQEGTVTVTMSCTCEPQ